MMMPKEDYYAQIKEMYAQKYESKDKKIEAADRRFREYLMRRNDDDDETDWWYRSEKENPEDQICYDEELAEIEAETKSSGSEDRVVGNGANATMISAIDKEKSTPQFQVPMANSEIVKSIEPGKVDLELEKLELNENLAQDWVQKNVKVRFEADGDDRYMEVIATVKLTHKPGDNQVWEPGGVLSEHDKWNWLDKCYNHDGLMRFMHWMSSMWWKEYDIDLDNVEAGSKEHSHESCDSKGLAYDGCVILGMNFAGFGRGIAELLATNQRMQRIDFFSSCCSCTNQILVAIHTKTEENLEFKQLLAAVERFSREVIEELAKRVVSEQKIEGGLICGDVKFHLKHKWRFRLLQPFSRLVLLALINLWYRRAYELSRLQQDSSNVSEFARKKKKLCYKTWMFKYKAPHLDDKIFETSDQCVRKRGLVSADHETKNNQPTLTFLRSTKQSYLSLRDNRVWDPGGSLVDAATPCLLSLHVTTLHFITAIIFLKNLEVKVSSKEGDLIQKNKRDTWRVEIKSGSTAQII